MSTVSVITPGEHALFAFGPGLKVSVGLHDNGDLEVFAERGNLTVLPISGNKLKLRLVDHRHTAENHCEAKLVNHD